MTVKRDYYEVLGISRDANGDVIKKSFRALAMQYHPDRNPDNPDQAAEKFKEASEAYEVLSDPDKRARYDRFGHEGMKSAFGGHDFQWENFTHASDVEDIFGDLFSAFMGGGRRSRPNRGADIEAEATLSLEEAFTGVEVEVPFTRRECCGTCKGSGAEPGTKPKACGKCGGSGQRRVQQGFFVLAAPCNACGGRGKVVEKPCGTCSGRGLAEARKKVSVKIPRGISHGQSMRLRGEGDDAPGGQGARGDLLVHVGVKEHEKFVREGENVLIDMPIHFHLAALGGKIRVPTLHGEEEVAIPPGTASHTVFKLRHKGMPVSPGADRFGDMFVRASIVVPRKLTDRQRELVAELGREFGDNAEHHRGEGGFFEFVKDIFR